MSSTDPSGRWIKAVLVAIATAVAGFVPAVGIYEAVRTLLSPLGHAEEAMGRGLEALFIGGPAIALLMAAVAGRAAYSFDATIPSWTPLAILMAGAVLGYALM